MNYAIPCAHSNKRKRADGCSRFDPTVAAHLAMPPLSLVVRGVLPVAADSTMASPQEGSAETASEFQRASPQLQNKRYRVDSISDLKRDQTSLVETLNKAQTTSTSNSSTSSSTSSSTTSTTNNNDTNNTCTHSYGDQINRISTSQAVVNTNIETLVITPSPKKHKSVIIFSVEALPGSIGVEVRLDKIGFKVFEICASSQLLGKVKIGDWLIAVGVELKNYTSANQLVQYLQKQCICAKGLPNQENFQIPTPFCIGCACLLRCSRPVLIRRNGDYSMYQHQ
jgi:hypothetical protein